MDLFGFIKRRNFFPVELPLPSQTEFFYLAAIQLRTWGFPVSQRYTYWLSLLPQQLSRLDGQDERIKKILNNLSELNGCYNHGG
jgi:hypothetical protein